MYGNKFVLIRSEKKSLEAIETAESRINQVKADVEAIKGVAVTAAENATRDAAAAAGPAITERIQSQVAAEVPLLIGPAVDSQVAAALTEQITPAVNSQVATALTEQIIPVVNSQVTTALTEQIGPAVETNLNGRELVSKVNNKTGLVVLTASDVDAAPALHDHTIVDVDGLQDTLDELNTEIASSRADVNTRVALAMPNALHDYTHGIPLERLAPSTQPFDFTGTEDSRAKLSAAITSAAGETILMPRKSRLFCNLLTPYTIPVEGVKIVGHDWTSQIKIYEDSIGAHYVDPVTGIDRQANDNGYFDFLTLNNSGPVWLEKLALIGDGAQPRIYEGHIRFLNGVGAGKVTMRDLSCLYSRAVAFWMQSPDGFEMTRSRIGLTCRGGLQVRFSKGDVKITDNDFWFTRDDAVNINWNYDARFGAIVPNMSRMVDVSHNRFYGSGGARMIGGSHMRFVGNMSRYGSTHMVAVGLVEDKAIPTSEVIIEGNQCLDMMRGPEPYAHGSDYCFARIRGTTPRAGGLAAIPGRTDPVTGDFIDPEPYLTSPAIDGAPLPAGGRIVVRNNTVGRKHTVGTAITAWESFEGVKGGFADGWATYVLEDVHLRPKGVLCEGAVDGLEVVDNNMSSMSHVMTLDLMDAVANTHKANIENNTFDDVSVAMFEHLSSGSDPGKEAVINWRRNRLDGDPRHRSPDRAPGKTGRWMNNTSNAAVGQLIKSKRPFLGTVLVENIISNVSRISDNNSPVYARDNILQGQPVAVGYHADNLGIGNAPASGDGYSWQEEVSDPHQPNYGDVTFRPPMVAPAMPASGLFVAGHYVRNSGSDRSVIGWQRATTGTGHVLGTDWLANNASAGPTYAPIVVVTGSGNPTTAATGPTTIIQDTAALTSGKNLTISVAPAGTIIHYINETTGGFTRTLLDGVTTLAVTSAGQSVRLFSTGTTWKVLASLEGSKGDPGIQGEPGPKGDPGANGTSVIAQTITQAAYDALSPPDPNIVYIIQGAP